MIKNEHNFQVNTQKIGPVRVSPRTESDLKWLVSNSLQELPRNLSQIKRVSSSNSYCPDDIWKHFPHKYQANLLLIDERAGLECTYPEAEAKAKAGEIPLRSPFMSGGGDLVDRNTAEINISVYTRPVYVRNQLTAEKWTTIDTANSIPAIKHETAHGVQSLLGDVIRESHNHPVNPWPSVWVTPLFTTEGYAMTQEWSTVLKTKDKQLIIQPLLSQAIKMQEIGEHNFLKNGDNLEDYLSSWVIQKQTIASYDLGEIWKLYITGLLLYLSVIGIQAMISAKDLVEEIENNPPIAIQEDEFSSLEISEKVRMFSNPPQWIQDVSNLLEFRAQQFYYSEPEQLDKAAKSVYNTTQGNRGVKIRQDIDVNKKMLHHLTDGLPFQELVDYTRTLSRLFANFGKKSPFLKLVKPLNKISISPISIYSSKHENPYLPIINRQLFLD